ncbi:chitin-binding domain-containing protein [Kitasatospora viridis]|nr:chitin-binding domain-containing protein [Kitasatospora viridis]
MTDGFGIDLEALSAAVAGVKQDTTGRLAPQQPGDKPAFAYNPETKQLHSTADPDQVAALDANFLTWITEQIEATSKTFAAGAETLAAAPAAASQPQAAAAAPAKEEPPQPYNYKYDVTDADGALSAAESSGNESGPVEGSYYVLLPDNRLMTVSYYVDGESGFVPQISFQENPSPL